MRQPIWIKIAITILILVVSSAGGVLFGSAITPDVDTAARRIKWASLGKPPEEPVRIVGIFVCDRSPAVVVRSASGGRYIACKSGWQVYNNLSGEPWYLLACLGNPPTSYSPGFESLPHPVRDCRLEYSGEWELAQEVYVILEEQRLAMDFHLWSRDDYWLLDNRFVVGSGGGDNAFHMDLDCAQAT